MTTRQAVEMAKLASHGALGPINSMVQEKFLEINAHLLAGRLRKITDLEDWECLAEMFLILSKPRTPEEREACIRTVIEILFPEVSLMELLDGMCDNDPTHGPTH